jgi:hypothetical protein
VSEGECGEVGSACVKNRMGQSDVARIGPVLVDTIGLREVVSNLLAYPRIALALEISDT